MREEVEVQSSTKKVQFYQLILAFLALLITIIVSVVNINSRITALEIKQQENEHFRVEIKNYFDKLNQGQTEILIKLENKTNRE
jgi:hypothetical protein